ncbi:MAG: hypothetical protein Ct9H300mP31_18140 [Acidimicrobiaceae bacterium]|nr:MAG: hypothetical protein Ct9H300mP31_18140 [Acidimicrobiaceae bacterium]
MLEYDATPEVLAAHAHRLREAGISVIGACCGSTPEHMAYIRRVLDGDLPVPDVGLPTVRTPSGHPKNTAEAAGTVDLRRQRLAG